MKTRILTSLLLLASLASPAWAGTRAAPKRAGAFAPIEASSLRALEDKGLGDLRAGAVAKTSPIQDVERSALVAASARAQDLGDLRAGDITLTDHDLTIIAIVVGVVLLIVIL